MAQSNKDPNANLDQTKITEAGTVELVEAELDQTTGGSIATPTNPAGTQPLSLLAKAASGKF